MTERGRESDDLDPPDWLHDGRAARGASPRRPAPRQGAVPPPEPADPRFPPDRQRRGSSVPSRRNAAEASGGRRRATGGNPGGGGGRRGGNGNGPDGREVGTGGNGGRVGRRAAERAEQAHRKRHRRRSIAALAVVLVLLLPFAIGVAWFVSQLDSSDDAEQGSLDAPSPDLELTLPPGLTLEQIAERVGELPGRDAATFLQHANSGQVRSRYQPAEVTSLEGLLFPDTYRIGNQPSNHEDELAILQRLVAEFDARAAAAGIDDAPSTIGRTPYEAIIIASLIEREAGVEEDRPLISAVIANRLRDGELLQIDAAGCYGKGGCDGAPLTDADKLSDSPYNTYRVPGLVPTPISSVGEASLQAALAPAAVSFKFYVLADESGAHAFADTLAEHEANIAESQRKGLL